MNVITFRYNLVISSHRGRYSESLVRVLLEPDYENKKLIEYYGENIVALYY